MKKCRHCGAIQNNSHIRCIDCGEMLGPPLSSEEERKLDAKISKKINKLSNKGDYFYVSLWDKIIAGLLTAGAGFSLIIKIFFHSSLQEMDTSVLLIVIILMAIEAVDLFCPAIFWELYKLRFVFSVRNIEEMEPSSIALYLRRITAYGICLAGYIYFISMFVRYIIL